MTLSMLWAESSKVAMLSEYASPQGTTVKYNVEKLKNHLVASQDLSKDLSTNKIYPPTCLVKNF